MFEYSKEKQILPVAFELINSVLSQNVSVSQILFIIIFNILSFYCRDFIQLILPNIILIALYVFINNGSIVFQLISNRNIQQNTYTNREFEYSKFVLSKGVPAEKSYPDFHIYYDNLSKFSSNNSLKKEIILPPVTLSNSCFAKFSCPTSPNLTTSNTDMRGNLKSTFSDVNCTSIPSHSSIFTPISSVFTETTKTSTSTYATIATTSRTTTSPSVGLCCSTGYNVSNIQNSNKPKLPNLTPVSDCSLPLPKENSILRNIPSIEKTSSTIENVENKSSPNYSNKIEISCDIKNTANSNTQTEILSNFVEQISPNTMVPATEIKALLSIFPKFNGNLKEYRSFKDKFKILVDHMALDKDLKALLLFSVLSENVVECLGSVTKEGCINYDVLWQQLDNEYCCPQNGPTYFGAALNSLALWDICNSQEKLIKLYKFLLTNIRALEREVGVQNDLVVAVTVLPKLEGLLLENVASFLAQSSGEPVMSGVLKLIKEEINRIEIEKLVSGFHEDFIEYSSIHSHKEVSSCTKSILSKSNSSKINGSCIFCFSSNHNSDECNKFSNPCDFHHSLFKRYLCFNCFQPGHKSYACPKPKQCSLCYDPRKHSKILCKRNF